MAGELAYPFSQVYVLGQGYGETGWANHPYASEYEPAGHGFLHWHAGLDIDAPAGTPILAAADGVVMTALGGCVPGDTTCNTGWGNYVIIQHTGAAAGLFTLYAHQQPLIVTVGQNVVRGQVIGHVDSTGNSTGAHLHFEVRRGTGGYGMDVDPGPYLTGSPTLPVPAISGPRLPITGQGGAGALTPEQLAAGAGDLTGQTAADLTTIDPSDPTQTPVPKPIGRDRALSLAQVTPRPERLHTVDGWHAHCLLAVYLSATQAAYLPVLDASVTTTSMLKPGTWSATLSLADLQSSRYAAVMAALMGRTRTQVAVLMGYVPDVRSAGPGDLVPMLTGVVDGPNRARYTSTSAQLPVRGPDMSGVLTAAWASGALADDTVMNQSPSDIAKALASQAGLHSVVSEMTDAVGGFDGQNIVTARQGQTDWDLLTQLAKQNGLVCYVDGTTLHFEHQPSVRGTPIDLIFAAAGQPTSLITEVEITQQAHSKHEYKIVVQSYSTQTKTTSTGMSATMTTAGSGNPDAPTIVTIPTRPNLSQQAVQTLADSILADYAQKELVLTAHIAGALALPRLTPVRLVSDRVWPGFATGPNGMVFQPASVTYQYSASGATPGIRQSIVATSRPLSIQTQATAASLDTSF